MAQILAHTVTQEQDYKQEGVKQKPGILLLPPPCLSAASDGKGALQASGDLLGGLSSLPTCKYSTGRITRRQQIVFQCFFDAILWSSGFLLPSREVALRLK